MEASVSEQLVKVLTAAHQHATQRKYPAAAQSLSKAAVVLPVDTHVHLCLAGMLLQAGNHSEAEKMSSLAIAFSADTAKTGHGRALRANIRWCQGNLLGAYEDLHIALAVKAINSSYAVNISEDLEWLAMQISACTQDPEGRKYAQEDDELATLEAVGKVAEAEAQEVAKLRMQLAESDTQTDHGGTSGSGDASGQLRGDNGAFTVPSQAQAPSTKAPIQKPPLAPDSTVQATGCAIHANLGTPTGPQEAAKGPCELNEHSRKSSSMSSIGGFAGPLPRQAEALDGVGDMTLHGIKPNMGGMASAHRPQAAVYSSPISSDHLCNVPKGHATMVSSTVSPTSADVSCCSGNRGTTSISASASQHHLHHAAVALQCTKQEIAEWSETAADSAASQGKQTDRVPAAEKPAKHCPAINVTQSPPDDAKSEAPVQGTMAPTKGCKAVAGCCLWRNTAIGVTLAAGCAAALVVCYGYLNAKRRSCHQ